MYRSSVAEATMACGTIRMTDGGVNVAAQLCFSLSIRGVCRAVSVCVCVLCLCLPPFASSS
jgi:hypothetical protein